MSNYIRGGTSNYGNAIAGTVDLPSVTVDSAGQTIFVMFHYRDNPVSAAVSPPTWNGEVFTELVNQGNLPGDDQQVLQVFYLTTASAGTFDIVATNAEVVLHAAAWALYSDVTSVAPVVVEEQWTSAGYTNPSLGVTGDGTVLSILAPSNWAEGFANVASTTWSPSGSETIRQSIQNTATNGGGWAIIADSESVTSTSVGFTPSANQPAYIHAAILIGGSTVDGTIRKSATGFTRAHGLGTITTATLGGEAITIASQVAGTVTLDETSGITTSGVYDLVLGDGTTTETYTYQVNVYGVAPSNNPLQKDGAAMASLTAVEVRVSAGATLAGSQLFYSGTATTDASGNLGNIDLSSTAAADTDPVLLSIRTAAGDSIIAAETVGLI